MTNITIEHNHDEHNHAEYNHATMTISTINTHMPWGGCYNDEGKHPLGRVFAFDDEGKQPPKGMPSSSKANIDGKHWGGRYDDEGKHAAQAPHPLVAL